MNPMLPNLLGGKMSSSHPPNTKIMFLDSPEEVTQKICKANANWTNGSINGVMASLRDILIPISELRWARLQNSDDHKERAERVDGQPLLDTHEHSVLFKELWNYLSKSSL